MYKNLVPLSSQKHIKLCLLPINNYQFATNELTAPIVMNEIADIAHEYPIIFPIGGFLPAALMGIEKNSNAYVSNNGEWLVRYIPAHIRHYPFALGKLASSPTPNSDNKNTKKRKSKKESSNIEEINNVEEKFIILLDMDSPFLTENNGDPLFDDKESLRGNAEQIKLELIKMQDQVPLTKNIVSVIEKAGLLKEKKITIRNNNQVDRQVNGVRVIDEALLNSLDNQVFNTLRNAGALPLIYASLFSWANFKTGPIGMTHKLPIDSKLSNNFKNEVIQFN